ncbi:hypothetical protein BOH72_16600 [Mycobacterium sp. WY10]|nr:hypothetical protein BOH72_16600 [Mycobacterium sp. WY10]
MCAADRDGTTVGTVGKIEVGLDGSVVRDDLVPRPTGHARPVEVGGQGPAEVTAVDCAGAPHGQTAYQVGAAGWLVGQLRAIALGQRTRGADRQLQAVAGELSNSRLVGPEAGFHDRDPARRVGRETFGEHGSGAAGTDDQDIAVRYVVDHQVRF